MNLSTLLDINISADQRGFRMIDAPVRRYINDLPKIALLNRTMSSLMSGHFVVGEIDKLRLLFVQAKRRGITDVRFVRSANTIQVFSLDPKHRDGHWIGCLGDNELLYVSNKESENPPYIQREFNQEYCQNEVSR